MPSVHELVNELVRLADHMHHPVGKSNARKFINGGCSRERHYIITLAQHLLASRTEQDRVLVLRHVRSLHVDQWWIWLHDAHVTQIPESQQILFLTSAINPSTAEGERIETVGGQAESGRSGMWALARGLAMAAAWERKWGTVHTSC